MSVTPSDKIAIVEEQFSFGPAAKQAAKQHASNLKSNAGR